MDKKIWYCKIGEVDTIKVPEGGDGPMRNAVRVAFTELTGEHANFLFSGWGAQLSESEREVVDNVPMEECVQRARNKRASLREEIARHLQKNDTSFNPRSWLASLDLAEDILQITEAGKYPGVDQ